MYIPELTHDSGMADLMTFARWVEWAADWHSARDYRVRHLPVAEQAALAASLRRAVDTLEYLRVSASCGVHDPEANPGLDGLI